MVDFLPHAAIVLGLGLGLGLGPSEEVLYREVERGGVFEQEARALAACCSGQIGPCTGEVCGNVGVGEESESESGLWGGLGWRCQGCSSRVSTAVRPQVDVPV